MLRRTERNLENITVGALGIIALDGCEEMGNRVNDYLVKWRREDGHIHKNDVDVYKRQVPYWLPSKIPMFLHLSNIRYIHMQTGVVHFHGSKG